ncbi:MAG TPA: LPS assembly protein LptD [Geobacteraceae bacterium]
MKLEMAIRLLIVFLAALLFPMASSGEEMLQSGGISIWADSLSYDQKSSTYRATGNVMIVWNGAILVSENAFFNGADNEAEATGKVRLVKGGDVLHCDRIKINLLTEQGEIVNGDLFSRKTNFHISGERMARLGDDKYRLEHGTFTACDGKNPSWKFTADNLDVTLEDFAVGSNAIFYIKDIPSFYTPYILFPVQRERQTGFLFPRIGNSTKKGFNIDIPYYWAISPSQEATVDLDVESRRGAGVGGEYNYKRESDSQGKIYGYSIFDTSQNKLRGNLVTQQQEWFSPSLVMKSDVDLVSDRTFFLDFSEENGIYNRQITDSSVSLTKNWQSASLAGEVRYVDDLLALSNRDTFQKLPNVNFTVMRQRLPGLPLYLALDSSYTNYYREDDVKGMRFNAHPFAQLYLAAPFGLDFTAWGGYRERFYNSYGGDKDTDFRSVGIADAGATVATSLTRIYDTDWGALRKIKHTMVPEVSYNFVEQKNQDNLPFFDYNDRVLGNTTASWAITNYLTGKYLDGDGAATYRDLLYLRLSQGYQLSGVIEDPLTGTPRDLLTLVDPGNHLTDLRIETNFSPLKGLSFFTDSRFNTNRTQFSTAMAGFDLKDDKGNKAGLSYHFSRGFVEYLEGNLTLDLVKPFIFTALGRYSLNKGGFLESSYSLEYRHQCWGVNFTYHDRPVLGDHAFTINFTLAGIGPVGKVKAF